MGVESSRSAIRKRSTRLRRLLTVLLTVLAGLLLLERFSAIGIQVARHGLGHDGARRLAFEGIGAVPEAMYLCALWGIRQALAAFAEGKLYAPTVTRMLDRVGAMLAAGALIGVFVVPGLDRLLGFGPGYLIAYDVSALVLGAVGLSLTVIADVLRRASDVQAELDEIF